MSLFTPFFLFGLLGIALPIWLHRLQTQTTEREQFGSTMFLEASKRRIHVKRKLKYLLLMALRILFLIILAIAFARPSLLLPPQPLVSEDSSHHIIVLDTSFSMQEGNSFEQGLALAEEIIENLEPGDQASLYSASSEVTPLAETTGSQAELQSAISGLMPDMGRLDIGLMVSSLNNLIEASQANFVLHIISDFQQSGQAVRFADMIPNVINGRPVTLVFEQVKSENTSNWSIDSVQVIDRDSVRVGIKNHSVEQRDAELTFILSVNELAQQELSQTISLPSDGIAFVLFEDVTFEAGDNKVDVQLTPGDSLAQDDLRHTVFDNSPPAPVLLLSANSDSLAVTYLTAALETAPRGYEVQLTEINDLDARILQRYPWIVIDDLGAINQSLADALTTYLTGGGSILAALGPNSQNLSSIPVTGQEVTRAPNLSQRNSHKINRIDTSHPALDRAIGWNNVNVSQSLDVVVRNEDNVLISLDNNTPLLIESNVGAGSLLLFTTSLDNSWSDLPVKPVFASFVAEAAQYLSRENVLIKEQIVDSYLQLSQTGGSSGQVFSPDGESLLSLADTTQAQDIILSQTGYYQVFTPSGEILIAVNSDARESDLTITPVLALQNWQNAVASSAGTTASLSGSARAIQEGEAEEMEIWRVFLLLLAIIVIAESLLGNSYLQARTDNG